MTPVQAIGKFYDGKTGQPYEVMIGLSGSGIRISCSDGTFEKSWSYNEVQVLEDAVPPQPAKLTSKKDPDARLFINPDHGWIRIKDKLPRDAFPAISLPDSWKSLIAYFSFSITAVILIFFAAPRLLENTSIIIPDSMEDKLGQYVINTIITDEVCTAPEGQKALQILVSRITNETQRDINYNVYVIDDEDTLNAMAAPGAYLALFSGVIDRAETPEEIAGILAHEIAHIELFHPTRSLVRDMGLSMMISMMTGSSDLGQIAGTLTTLSYSRDDENEADQTGRDLLAAANIDPKSMALFFENLLEDELKELEADKALQDSDDENITLISKDFSASTLAYFSTHPQTETRINKSLEAKFDPATAKPILTAKEFKALKNICHKTEDL